MTEMKEIGMPSLEELTSPDGHRYCFECGKVMTRKNSKINYNICNICDECDNRAERYVRWWIESRRQNDRQ